MLLFHLTVIFLLSTGCRCSNEIYKGQQVWRINAKTKKQVSAMEDFLQHPAIMVEHHHSLSGSGASVTFRVAEKDFAEVETIVNSVRMNHEVLVEDVQAQLDLEEMNNGKNRPKRSTDSMTLDNFDYEVYHPLDEIYHWMDLQAEKYDEVEVLTIGKSLENRSLKVLRIATNQKKKPIFYLDSAIHAREWIAPATLMYVCNQLLSNESYADILDKLDFYFVPVVNVDGYFYTWTQERLWRKTRRPYTGSSINPMCVGVDANRNWNSKFGGAGASPNPCSNLYRGPHAESEPVIHHLANFIRKAVPNIKAVVSFHNWGRVLLYPYNHNLTLAAPTEKELNETGTAMVTAMTAVNGETYNCGRGSVLLYVFSGTTTDWTYENAGVNFSYTLELRDRGEFAFELPEDQILGTGQEVMPGMEILARKVISKYSA